jgi:hypothetical protein
MLIRCGAGGMEQCRDECGNDEFEKMDTHHDFLPD